MSETGNREEHPYHRKFIRHRVRVKVEVQNGKAYNSWTINLSEDGLCFEIPTQLPVGTDVAVWIFMSRIREDEPVIAAARVMWNDRGKKGFRHGGQFVEFSGGGRERLAAWLKVPNV